MINKLADEKICLLIICFFFPLQRIFVELKTATYQIYLGFWKNLQIFVIAFFTEKYSKTAKTVCNVKFLKTFGEIYKFYKP